MTGQCVHNLGSDIMLFEPVILGFPSRDHIGKDTYPGVTIGNHAIIRTGTILYSEVTAGDYFSTGHNVLVRERTILGDHVSLGTNVIIEGQCVLGDHVNLQSLVYIPTNTRIGSHVFIGPNSVLTNDKYPPHGKPPLTGPILEDHVSVGANVTILPGVTIGEGSLVAAAALVTKDVPPYSMAIGSPSRVVSLPEGANQ